MKTTTAEELIQDTVDYYLKNPRGLDDDGDCTYYCAVTGNRCAVGRWSISEALDAYEGRISDFLMDRPRENDKEPELDEFLDPKVRGHSEAFWHDLQRLHDFEENWEINNEGEVISLSWRGESTVEKLLRNYAN